MPICKGFEELASISSVRFPHSFRSPPLVACLAKIPSPSLDPGMESCGHDERRCSVG